MHINILQDKANELILMPKVPENNKVYDLPTPNKPVAIPLKSEEGADKFFFDLEIDNTILTSFMLQVRWRIYTILLRLELRAPRRHGNPNRCDVGQNHLHIYRHPDHDKWAYPVPGKEFPHTPIDRVDLLDPLDFWQTLLDFVNIANIITLPNFKGGLFT